MKFKCGDIVKSTYYPFSLFYVESYDINNDSYNAWILDILGTSHARCTFWYYGKELITSILREEDV